MINNVILFKLHLKNFLEYFYILRLYSILLILQLIPYKKFSQYIKLNIKYNNSQFNKCTLNNILVQICDRFLYGILLLKLYDIITRFFLTSFDILS